MVVRLMSILDSATFYNQMGLQELEDSFRHKMSCSLEFPKQSRKPTDSLCVTLLVMALFLFFGLGSFLIFQGYASYK